MSSESQPVMIPSVMPRPASVTVRPLRGAANWLVVAEMPRMKGNGAQGRESVMLANELKALSLFERLGDSQLQRVADLCTLSSLAPNHEVFHQGDAGDTFYMILSGAIRIIRDAGTPTEKLLATLNGGACFGEMGPIMDQPRSATAVAEEATTLVAMDKTAFLLLLKDFPLVKMKLLATMARRQGENVANALAKLEDTGKLR